MTDTPAEVEAARALVAAYDALNSPEHEQDITERRVLDNQRLAVHERICARESAYAVHLNAKQKRDEAACANGTPAADNTEAAKVIDPKAAWASQFLTDDPAENDDALFADGVLDLRDLTANYNPEDDDLPEDQTASAAGALNN